MKIEHIKNYVENQLNVDLNNNSRVRRNIYAKAIFYELAYYYATDKNNKKYTIYAIAKFLNKNHATVLHHRKNTVPYVLKYEPEFKIVYDNFDRSTIDPDLHISEKYDILMNKYVAKLSEKAKEVNNNIELEKLIGSINEDKIDLFIERAKPMIKMINKAKFN